MKNYFTTVNIPSGACSTEALGRCVEELISQLRYTINNLDTENFTKEAAKEILSPGIHLLTEEQISKGIPNGVKKGDIVLCKGNTECRLSRIDGMYFCVKD